MPMRNSAYPPDWKQISLRIRERAGWKCEQCGLPNGALIRRSSIDGARYMTYIPESDWFVNMDGSPIRLSEIPDEYWSDDYKPYTKVILTVHHIGIDGDPHDKMDCRPENLIALCARCHLIADMPTHVKNAKRTRLAKKREKAQENGQMELFT